MLPAPHRMRRSADFSTAVRTGARGGRPCLVVHLARAEAATVHTPSTVGLVVSRAVGGAVVRNRVRRRLRHLAAARLGQLPPGSRLVVRALPPAAGVTGTELAADLDSALARAVSRLGAEARS